MKILVVSPPGTNVDAAPQIASTLQRVSGLEWRIAAQELASTAKDQASLLGQHQIVRRANVGEIDTVWSMVDTGGEFHTLGAGDYGLTRELVILTLFGYDPTRADYTHALHHFGHMAEEHLTAAFGSWNCAPRASGLIPRVIHDWDRFSCSRVHLPTGFVAKGDPVGGRYVVGCGNCHTAPNGRPQSNGLDYDYGPGANEYPPGPMGAWWSNYPAWVHYPDLDPTACVAVDENTWGQSRIDGTWESGLHEWWLAQIPKNPGTHVDSAVNRTIQNNWWAYLTNDGLVPAPSAPAVPLLPKPWSNYPNRPGWSEWITYILWIRQYGSDPSKWPAVQI